MPRAQNTTVNQDDPTPPSGSSSSTRHSYAVRHACVGLCASCLRACGSSRIGYIDRNPHGVMRFRGPPGPATTCHAHPHVCSLSLAVPVTRLHTSCSTYSTMPTPPPLSARKLLVPTDSPWPGPTIMSTSRPPTLRLRRPPSGSETKRSAISNVTP